MIQYTVSKEVTFPVQRGHFTLWRMAWNPGTIHLSSPVFTCGTVTFLWYFDFLFGLQVIKGKKHFKLLHELIL